MDKALDLIRVNFKTEKSLDQRMAGRENGNARAKSFKYYILTSPHLTGKVDMVATTSVVVTAVVEDMAISSMVSTVVEDLEDVLRSSKWSSTSTSCWLSTCRYSSTHVGLAVA